MKSFLVFFLLFSYLFPFVPQVSFASEYDYYLQEFVVSAYYSPLPGQMRYLRANYEAEKRLNGNGTNGADGTEVFAGMLAAPKTYAFGTKIEIPGLGVGSVHDRGGAIVEKEGYHRIDVWMGHGDQGLTRALNWGMRRMTGKVFFEKNKNITLDYSWISGASPVVAQKKATETVVKMFTSNLSEGMISSEVVALKKALSDLGFFSLEVNNNYFDGELKKALIRFQESSSVISSSADYGAGFFGEKTRTALETALKNPDLKVTTQEERKEKVQMQIVAGISKNSLKEDVKNLQTVLKNLGYYSGDIHGEYNEDLINAIFAFQLDSGVVDSEASLGAGSFGPKTFAALENVIVLRKEKLKSFPQSKFSLVEALEEENKQQKFVSVDTGNFPDFKFKEYASQFAYGDTGNEVLSLQKTLVAYGLLEEKHATGFFGNITKTALEKALM